MAESEEMDYKVNAVQALSSGKIEGIERRMAQPIPSRMFYNTDYFYL